MQLSLIIALVLASAGLVVWFLVLPVLRQKAELSSFFNEWELKQAGFFARLKLGFAGLRTKLWNRFLILAGLLVPLLEKIMDFDLASILQPVPIPGTSIVIPPTMYVPIVLLPTIGAIGAYFRSITKAPTGVPSAAQIATIIPDAPAAVVEAKAAEIAEVKTEKAA